MRHPSTVKGVPCRVCRPCLVAGISAAREVTWPHRNIGHVGDCLVAVLHRNRESMLSLHACSFGSPLLSNHRRFCVAIMDKLIRLSYWERIQSVIPEEFRVLLPPKPAAEVPEEGSEESEWTSKMLKLVRGCRDIILQRESGLERRNGSSLPGREEFWLGVEWPRLFTMVYAN